MPAKRTKKVKLGINHTQVLPNDHDIVATLGQ